MQTFKKFWIFLLIWINYSNNVSAGDQCLTSTDKPGVCTTLQECPSIINDINQGKLNHAICRFEGFEQVVCCPSVNTTSTSAPTSISTERISVRKCNEYKEFAYDKVYIDNAIGTPPVEAKVSNCAFISVPLIVGGTVAIYREFPHMALIGYNAENTVHWDCGGMLISEQFILSAAHCIDTMSGPAKYVRLGEHDLDQSDDASHIDLNIIESIPHPEYKYPSWYHDIGLLKLERRIEFSSAIRPACLPEQSDFMKERAIASGWGFTGANSNRSKVLLKVILDMFSQEECKSNYGKHRRLQRGFADEIQMCAGSRNEEKDTCRGDSGGPLQIYHKAYNCSYTIIGVTSVGKGCGNIGLPGIYTRVHSYLDWIEDVVWLNE